MAEILNADRVRELFLGCLFKEGEDTTNHVKVEGVMQNIGFHPDRVKAASEEIGKMLMELPDDFMKSKGGGMSFLQACMDKHGNHWAEHQTMDQLFSLGQAVGKCEYPFPRNMWKILPGGMPYIAVLDQKQ